MSESQVLLRRFTSLCVVVVEEGTVVYLVNNSTERLHKTDVENMWVKSVCSQRH